MDGPHDLGGRQGFGPIDVNEPEEPFHADWEARLYGIARAVSKPDDWSIDWFRHCRELIDPVDYLSRPYFDSWAQTYAAMLVNSGVATVEELATGRSAGQSADLPALMTADEARKAAASQTRSDSPDGPSPAFAVGDRVRTNAHGVAGHTRLPQYARGATGVVHAYRGAHILPDAMSAGETVYQPLYTVGFDAAEFWGAEATAGDMVYLDLWESYLGAG